MKNMRCELFDFLDKSKTAYHAVDNIAKALCEAGYVRLYENDVWELASGGKYFVIRDGSSIIAFRNGGGPFMIGAAHSDSPAFRVKDVMGGRYARLDTEKYGGLIHYTWLDRPLALSGRAVVREGGNMQVKLVELDAAVVIPSLAIHLNRSVNEGAKFSLTSDMIPLASVNGKETKSLKALVAEALGTDEGSVISHEIYLTAKDSPVSVGLDGELVLSPRLDDLSAAYALLKGLLEADTAVKNTPVLAVFDNEEVGSSTKQGAASDFLYDTLMRIAGSDAAYRVRIADSFMVSADNAHACHPNHPELSDAANAPVLGGGVVIKHNANQRYTTDAVSEAIFRELALGAGVSVQNYFNRADQPGGSTLGSIANTKVAVATVDIGIPQLAMHSAVETCAISDVADTVAVAKKLYESVLSHRADALKLV